MTPPPTPETGTTTREPLFDDHGRRFIASSPRQSCPYGWCGEGTKGCRRPECIAHAKGELPAPLAPTPETGTTTPDATKMCEGCGRSWQDCDRSTNPCMDPKIEGLSFATEDRTLPIAVRTGHSCGKDGSRRYPGPCAECSRQYRPAPIAPTPAETRETDDVFLDRVANLVSEGATVSAEDLARLDAHVATKKAAPPSPTEGVTPTTVGAWKSNDETQVAARLATLIATAHRIVEDARGTHESMGRFDLDPIATLSGGNVSLKVLAALLPYLDRLTPAAPSEAVAGDALREAPRVNAPVLLVSDDDVRRAVCRFNDWDYDLQGRGVSLRDSHSIRLRHVLEGFVPALRAALASRPAEGSKC